MGRIIGIDLGTTNSVVAVLEGSEPKVIANEEGRRVTPSVVGITEGGEVLVGEVARRQAVMNPSSTLYSIKRFMGRRFSEVGEEAARVTYDVVEADNGDAALRVHGKTWSPPEVSARVLQKLKRAAENFLGEPVTEAVITVPAYFNDAQRKATRDAGEIAGLKVRRVISEPTAAAVGYGFSQSNANEFLAVYDLGGGTFDISILEISDDVVEVLSTNGDTHLGGDDIDDRIVKYLLEEFQRDTELDVSGDRMVLQRLREAAEKAKIELSSVMETDINLPFLTADATGPKHLHLKMTRAKLEYMIEDLVARSLEPCKQALRDAGKLAADIQKVMLVGGSTRIPLVQRKVSEFFDCEPFRGVNPDEAVALGAAVQGGALSGDVQLVTLDVTPLSLGLETQGGVMAVVIPRNTTIPTRRVKRFSTVVDNQSSVDIRVFQGERDFVADNRSLGRFELTGIPPAPRATPKIEVSLDIDANGILSVSAEEIKTKIKASITIHDAGGLSQDEINRAVQDADDSAEQDRARRRRVELRNRLSGLLLEVTRQARDHETLLTPEDNTQIEAALTAARPMDGSLEDYDETTLEAVNTGLSEALRCIQDRVQAHAAAAQEEASASDDASQSDATQTEAPQDDDTTVSDRHEA